MFCQFISAKLTYISLLHRETDMHSRLIFFFSYFLFQISIKLNLHQTELNVFLSASLS